MQDAVLFVNLRNSIFNQVNYYNLTFILTVSLKLYEFAIVECKTPSDYSINMLFVCN